MISKKPPNSKGVDYFSVIEKYIEVLNSGIGPTDNQTLWWRGIPMKNGISRFVHSLLAIYPLRKIPLFMAKVMLNFDNEAIKIRYYFFFF